IAQAHGAQRVASLLTKVTTTAGRDWLKLPTELVRRLDETAVALRTHLQSLAGTRSAKGIGARARHPHGPIPAAGTEAKGVGKRVGQDRLDLHALAGAGFR